MPWITSVMLVDDEPSVLESLIPSMPHELGAALARSRAAKLLTGEGGWRRGQPLGVRVVTHGYESQRVRHYHQPTPHQVTLHLVRDPDGQFQTVRSLLNRHLFAAVISDLRFANHGPGARAGRFLVEELERIQPETRGILYSAYPAPAGFPANRFVRKGPDGDGPGLVPTVVAAIEEHLSLPEVEALARAVLSEGLIYQSEAFGAVLTQCYALGRLVGQDLEIRGNSRSRRPLPIVLLDGESGTGKRGLAAVIHAVSHRRSQPLVIASCNDLTHETLLRSILFGHRRGAFTDAREDRVGLVATAGRGVLVLDDFHRLPASCTPILHSFLEDGQYSRVGEEEVRRQAECLVVATVETQPWRERRRSGELSMAFLARVERFPIFIPPLRERSEDIEVQARHLVETLAAELRADLELDADALARLRVQPFAESNSRELRNALENAVYRNHKQTDVIGWEHLAPWLDDQPAQNQPTVSRPALAATAGPAASDSLAPPRNAWQERLVALASSTLARGTGIDEPQARAIVERLFREEMPVVWARVEAARQAAGDPLIPMPIWEDLWRCFAVYFLGGPTPAERVLGIPANTLRQWINDREARRGASKEGSSKMP
ncbi:MAG: hypothetical protein KatS3mg108_1665 [Isosphaeraceae bacterium]|jgi:transcriptional regulator with AAA-type ATPase domain|nr:MAG: hypothetical protein KatS3mg108_1665 [Isosphaeraceae bacterium]